MLRRTKVEVKEENVQFLINYYGKRGALQYCNCSLRWAYYHKDKERIKYLEKLKELIFID